MPLGSLELLPSLLHFQVCRGSPPGVWVCSTDMLLTVPTETGELPKGRWGGQVAVVMVCRQQGHSMLQEPFLSRNSLAKGSGDGPRAYLCLCMGRRGISSLLMSAFIQ